ncbi:MAG: ester cyclase [bacterium]|nr:ester cyclase [bacterium]
MKRKSLTILWLLVGCFAVLPAADEVAAKPDPVKTAAKYMKLLTSGDFNGLAKLYDEEVGFDDFTAEAVVEGGYHLRGKTEIIDFWKSTSKGRISYSFTPRKQFRSGDYVVMTGVYRYKGTGEPLGLPKDLVVQLTVDAVTTLKIVNGKIRHHLDQVDYTALMKQLEKQKKAYEGKG